MQSFAHFRQKFKPDIEKLIASANATNTSMSTPSPVTQYIPGPDAIDLTPEKDGGVLKEIVQAGEGDEKAITGDRVFVHYVGTLAEDGSKFDSSRDRGELFEFSLGKNEVIKAWDIGVASMKKGEVCKLICRSDYAYGERGSPPKIPGGATLIFEVELFEWRGEDLSTKKDGGIIRRIVSTGDGMQTPNEGAIVDVHVIGKYNGHEFDNRTVKFLLGEGSEFNIPEGVEKSLEKFKKGEKSLIKLAPKYAFGSAGNSVLGVPANATLDYELELVAFEKAKDSWEMDQEEKIEQAKLHKDRGTQFFKDEKFRLAVKQYKKVVDLLQYDSGLDEEKKAERNVILLAGYLNLSMTYLKLGDNLHTKEFATRALELDPKNVKALFRRGQSHLALGNPLEANTDFKACLEFDPKNKAAASQLLLCVKAVQAQKDQEKKLYGGMFDKFAKQDLKKEGNRKDVMAGDLGEWGNGEAPKHEGDSIENVDGDLADLADVEMLNGSGII